MKNLLGVSVAATLAASSAFALAPNDFAKKVPISVSETAQTAIADVSAENVPVLVRLSESIAGFYYSDLAADGSDLAFGIEEGGALTIYPHEIETWDPNGTSLVWVKVPKLSAATAFGMYYGNGVKTGVRSTDAWSDYVGVWHLDAPRETTVANSFGEYANATATEGINGHLAEKSIPNEEGKFGKSFRVNDVTKLKTGNFNYGGVWVPGTDALKLGDTFAISGWFKGAADGYYYDHLFYKRAASDNSASKGATGAFAIEINASSGKIFKPGIRGNSSTTATINDTAYAYDAWNYVTFVFNGASASMYVNGKSIGSGTITAATDNDAALVFGNNCNIATGAVGDAAFAGWIDEVRLMDGVPSAAYLALEYAAMTEENLLAFGAVEQMDATMPVFESASVSVSDGAFIVVYALKSGEGAFTAELTDVATGEKTTAPFSAGETSVAISAASLVAGHAYDCAVIATSAAGNTSSRAAGRVFNGSVAIVRTLDADEATLASGTFTVTASAPVPADLTIPYTVGGTAVAGVTYETLSGAVTIPAGTTSATIAVQPIFSPDVAEDVTVSVTLEAAASFVATASAELTVVNAAVDPNARYVSTRGSDEEGTGLRDGAFASIDKALTTLGETGGTIWLEDGEYPITATVTLTTPVTIRSVSGDPEKVTLKRTSGDISVVKLNCAEARILDVTVANGGNSKVDGGNVYIDANGGIVEHCILLNGNSSGQYGKAGGGVYMKAGVVTRCIIRSCSANYAGGGGGVYMSGGQLENSLITECAAGSENGATYAGDNGGGVRLNGANAKLVNCTIALNRGNTCPGVRIEYDSKTKAPKGSIINCVIVDNRTMKGLWDFSNVGGVKDAAGAFVNCVTDARLAQPNETCLGAPFAFADRANKDYRITAASSAVDAGVDVELYSSLDLDGNPRVSGSAIDAGCYELRQDAPAIAVGLVKEELLVDEEVTLAATTVGTVDGAIIWTIGDSEPVEGEATRTHVFDTVGYQTVTAATTIGGVPVTSTVTVKVCPKTIYVDAASTTAVEPFATPETATPSFATGYAWATDGTTVNVASGTYPVTAQTLVKKGIVIEGATGDPSDVTVKASGNVRVFWISHPDAVLRNVTVSGGKAIQSVGSNVYLDAFGGTVSNCVLTGGVADNYNANGGNLYQVAGLVTHSKLLNSTVNNVGGGTKGGNATLEGGVLAHSLIAGGADTTTGSKTGVTPGVRLTGTGELVNCTVAGQSAKGSSISGVIVASDNAKVTNCVIAGNTSTGDAACWSGTVSRFVNCAVDAGGSPNETCVSDTTAALLADAPNGDYHAAPGAPSVDAGAGLENPPSVDLDGNVRVLGKGIDMGCYEYEAGSLAVTFDADFHEAICPTEITFTAVVDGAGEGASLTYAWDFDGDGVADATTSEPTLKRLFEAGGMVSVGLVVTDGTSGLSASAEKPDIVKLAPRIIYVDAAGENPTAPYASWETAALQPKDAVAVAVNGCEIIVRGGTYALPGMLTVDKDVLIHAESDAEVIFKAGYFTVMEVNHPDARIAGITLADAVANAAPGGVYFGSQGGMVSNCVIRNCRTYNWSGSGGAASFGGPGVLTHSVVTGCSADTWCGGGTKYVLEISRGRFENNLVIGCHSGDQHTAGDCAALLYAGSASVVRNNTFVNNRTTNRGLINVHASATFANNVFADNSYITRAEDTVNSETEPVVHSSDVGFNFGTSAAVDGVPAFVNCATDGAEPVNETCVVGTLATLFKDYANGDYTPNASGPLYNKGVTPEGWSDLADLAGKPRVQGKAIDIGCYEVAPSGLRISIR